MMGIISKRILLPLFLAAIMCVAIFWPDQVVRAADVTQTINNVSVEITPIMDSPTSQVQLKWEAVSPVNGGSISYDIKKSTDGGSTFGPVPLGTAITALTWTDSSVQNYTNVIYQVRSEETTGGTTTSSAIKVFPPNVNVHDNYMNITNLCSKCHSTHTAKTVKLLNQPSASALCLTCHAGSANSKYDVSNGKTMTAGSITQSSLGGAFKDATSAHKDGSGGSPMECTDCHSAHGTDSYRMLKSPTSGVNVLAGAKANDSSQGETPVYISGIESFCQSCHTDSKFASGGSGHPLNIALRAPMTTSLPLEGTITDRANHTDKMMCLTCHYSHGSTSGNLTVSPGNDLCFKCHATVTEPTSGFSNDSQLNLHNSIGSSGGHLDCSSCHVSHGDFRKGLLIGGGNPITAIDSGSGTNNWYYDSCATSCHRPGSGA